MSVSYKRSIKLKLLLSMLALFLLAGAVFVAVSYNGERVRERSYLAEKVEVSARIFLAGIDADREALIKALATVARMDEFLRLLSQNEKDMLLAAAKPLFDELKAKFRITHLYFIDPAGKVLLRVHKPEQAGDVLTRITYNQARQSGGVGAGIEMGKNFFSLRAIQPVSFEGRPAGYIELGQEIDHAFERFKKLTKNDAAVLLTRDYLKARKAELKGAEIGAFTLLDATDKPLAEELAKQVDLSRGLKEFSVAEAKTARGEFVIGLLPFRDAAGEVAGVLMVQMDVSALIAAAQRSFLLNMAIFFALFAVIALLTVWVFNRTVIDPVLAISGQIGRIGGGDLTVRIDSKGRDEIAMVAGNVNDMVASLREMVTRILDSAGSVANIMETVKARAEKAEGGGLRQEGLAGQVATAIEEIARTIEEIARSTALAAESSEKAMTIASEGKQVADGAVATVNGVYASSQELAKMVERLNLSVGEIEGILGVITNIAGQTNLLALNAAIEAARAGEQGRGFAVVADEVRKLAERTIQATKEIAEKINALQSESAQTTRSMEEASGQVTVANESIRQVEGSLQSITDAVQDTRDQITRIAAAVEQQSATSQQVAGSTAHNVELARETAEEMKILDQVEALLAIAAELRQSTEKFRL